MLTLICLLVLAAGVATGESADQGDDEHVTLRYRAQLIHVNGTACEDNAVISGSITKVPCDSSVAPSCMEAGELLPFAMTSGCFDALADMNFSHVSIRTYQPVQDEACNGPYTTWYFIATDRCDNHARTTCDEHEMVIEYFSDDTEINPLGACGGHPVKTRHYPVNTCIPGADSHYGVPVSIMCEK